jgi:hypothetical protein
VTNEQRHANFERQAMREIVISRLSSLHAYVLLVHFYILARQFHDYLLHPCPLCLTVFDAFPVLHHGPLVVRPATPIRRSPIQEHDPLQIRQLHQLPKSLHIVLRLLIKLLMLSEHPRPHPQHRNGVQDGLRQELHKVPHLPDMDLVCDHRVSQKLCLGAQLTAGVAQGVRAKRNVVGAVLKAGRAVLEATHADDASRYFHGVVEDLVAEFCGQT